MRQGETPTMDARAQAIEVVARVLDPTPFTIADPGDVTLALQRLARVKAEELLDALLQPTEPCKTCNGVGYWTATRDEVRHGAPPPPAPFNACPAGCSGGLVQRPPLLILAAEADALVRALGWALGFVSDADRKNPIIAQVYEQAQSIRRARLAVEGEQPDA